jgi:hypothetical protein
VPFSLARKFDSHTRTSVDYWEDVEELLTSGSCVVGSGIVTAFAVLPLDNQSISRGPRRPKNNVSMTLPALG